MSEHDLHDDDTTTEAEEPRGQLSTRQEPETSEVDAIPYEEDAWDGFDDPQSELPGRPRRVYVNRWTALLAAVVIGAACFYAGVRVEKAKVGSSGATGASGRLAALAGRFGGAGGAAAGGTSAAGASTSTTASSTRGAGRFSGGAGGFPGAAGFGGAGAGATVGTVSSIDGDTVYVTDTSGNTVAVKLSKTTTIKKSESVSSGHIYPGDSLVIAGSAAKSGTISATSVTDSGAGASTASTGSSSSAGSTGSSGSSSSALNSLF